MSTRNRTKRHKRSLSKRKCLSDSLLKTLRWCTGMSFVSCGKEGEYCDYSSNFISLTNSKDTSLVSNLLRSLLLSWYGVKQPSVPSSFNQTKSRFLPLMSGKQNDYILPNQYLLLRRTRHKPKGGGQDGSEGVEVGGRLLLQARAHLSMDLVHQKA